jgi:anti-sigma factor ChrR (cupin superfamily)
LFTFRSKLPDNYKIPPHFHLSNEHITVISGTFAMGLGRTFDENALRPMSVGSFMVMPRKVAHFALTHGETIVQVHAIGPMTFTYVDPKDDPRKR